MQRILITGSRDWTDYNRLVRTIQRYMAATLPMLYNEHAVPTRRAWDDTVIVHGGAIGADRLAAHWADGCDPPIKTEAHALTREDWQRNPRMAGYERNIKMVDLGADVCLAFIMPCRKADCPRIAPHGSHGASHCSDYAESVGIQTIRVTP